MKDTYSLPRIEHALDQLLGSTIFTTLDLKAGYWQVEMVEECKPSHAGPSAKIQNDLIIKGFTLIAMDPKRYPENREPFLCHGK